MTSMVRSTRPEDYQDLSCPVAVMAKSFAAGFETPLHHHTRDQLIYAQSGVMRVHSERETWIVPPKRAVYIVAGIAHKVAMRGNVEMRTLYIDANCSPNLPKSITALEVSTLLRALILSLLNEPLDYGNVSRGGDMVRLILSEITRARRLSLGIPMPKDIRLRTLCDALLRQPERSETLEEWSLIVGASVRTLSRLFSSQTGMSFTAWRQRVRFHNAMEALVGGEPIAKVAHKNGYSSPSAFTHSFRKTFGVTPSSLGSGPYPSFNKP